MIRVVAASAALAAGALLAACGGPDLPLNFSDAAEQAGCNAFYHVERSKFLTYEEGTCMRHGREYQLVTFRTPEAQEATEELGKSFGTVVRTGEGWMLTEQL